MATNMAAWLTIARMCAPLAALDVPWTMKPLDSAETSVERLADRRLRFSIRHDVLRGVTPAMLVWWFNNIAGDMDLGGRPVPRYRVWHPRDHVLLEYVRKARDGRNFGPGARVHIVEFLGGRPEYKVDILSTIEFLDETGLAHSDRITGLEVARLDYRFTPVDGGTLYRNSLTVGSPGPAAVRFLVNRFVRPRLFPEEMGEAWLRHNVEEVGNFEYFLPALYQQSQPGSPGTAAPAAARDETWPSRR
ncbi:MAG: hypothetical protein HYR51_17495 [Candidatus Rokubacteria bacterium]|nr:hypothetical protein [Candidatus Rokubacteria bacterium]